MGHTHSSLLAHKPNGRTKLALRDISEETGARGHKVKAKKTAGRLGRQAFSAMKPLHGGEKGSESHLEH